MNAIEVKGLTKNFKQVAALRGMSFAVPRGSLCGFIGLNGAGKTTTLKILMEMLRADAGTATVLGYQVGRAGDGLEIRRRTGFLPEGKRLFPYMTVEDAIAFTRGFYATWRKEKETHLRTVFELAFDRKVKDLSKGMLSKLQLLLALARGAELVILDEPTDGLDAVAVEEVLQELAGQVAEAGVTVLFCSHRMEEIEQVADHLVIVHEGRCLLGEPIDQLRAQARRLLAVLPDRAIAETGQLAALGSLKQDGRSVSLTVWKEADAAEARLRDLGATSIEAEPLPLRSLFVDMVRPGRGKKETGNVVA